MMVRTAPTPGRNIIASIIGALMLFIGTTIMLPSQVEVKAANPFDDMKEVSESITQYFEQLKGDTNGTLCSKSAGLTHIRNKIDKYENLGPRTQAKSGGTPVKTENYHLTTRLIACMVSPIDGDGAAGKPGYVIFYGKQLVDAIVAKFLGVLSALALLALVLWGIRMVMGYARELQSSTIVLVAKIGLLFWALSSTGMLYEASVGSMNKIAGQVAAAIPTSMCPEVEKNIAEFANAPGGDRTFLLPWVKLDCAVESIAAMILDSTNTAVGNMVVALLSAGVSKALSASFFAGLFTLFNVMNLALFIVVLANLAVVLMFMIAPICWVCIMFKPTMKYFHKWLTLTIGFLLQPILLTLFLMIMVSAYEQVICKQPFSVVGTFNEMKGKTGHYGAEYCTRTRIQESMTGLIDDEYLKAMSSKVIPGTAEITGDKETADGLMGVIVDKLKNVSLDMLEKVIGAEGFSFTSIDVPQIKAAFTGKMQKPFQSMLAAFTVMFILYAFLQQLPNFINQLASSAVTSGNLNQANMPTAAQKGLQGLDKMTNSSQFSTGAFSNFSSMRQGMFKGGGG